MGPELNDFAGSTGCSDCPPETLKTYFRHANGTVQTWDIPEGGGEGLSDVPQIR